MASNPVIRNAKREDVATILAFMRATAAEQGVAHAVTATEAALLDTLDFDDSAQESRTASGKVFLIVAPDNEIAGMAIYFFTYAAWVARPGVCLEDLFVLPKYRRLGYARLLVQAVAKQAKILDCERVEWLCYKNNQRALKFYASLGAKDMDNITLLRMDRAATVELVDGKLEQ